MKRILIATDGSPSSLEAVELGLELAVDEGADVTFVHVAAPIEWLVGGFGAPVAVPAHEGLTIEEDTPLTAAAELAHERGVKAELVLAKGVPVDEIVRAADAADADLVVVGSRGLGLVGRAVLGSVSRGVLRRSERPVLVVRAQKAPVPA